MNPVIMLDEVDKLGADWRGDPSSALLEVLDPAQNHTFRDHYLEVDLDLSDVLFIATANVVDTIPGPAARPHGGHPPRRLHRGREGGHRPRPPARRASSSAPGCGADEVTSPTTPCGPSSADYTREAGVRNLERELGKLLRKVATRIAVRRGRPRRSSSTPTTSASWLGRPKFFFEAADRTAVPGVATGLAVTGTGGDVLFIEATVDGRRAEG